MKRISPLIRYVSVKQAPTFEGWFKTANQNGTILFSSDDINLWKKTHRSMSKINGVHFYRSSSKSAIEVSKSGSPPQHLIFTADEPERAINASAKVLIPRNFLFQYSLT